MDKGPKHSSKEGEHTSLRAITTSLFDSLKRTPTYPSSIPGIYDELRRLVRISQKHLRAGDASQAQPVLSQAFQKQFDQSIEVPQSGQLTILAALMRQLIVEYAKARQLRDTRGGMGALMDEMRQRLDTAMVSGEIDVVAMDAALTELEQRHRNSARLIELRYFADLGSLDIALELGVSTVTVERNLRFARTWLYAFLKKRGESSAKT